MEILQYSILIDANRQKVWDTMLNDTTYRLWTKPFHPTSHYSGTWEKGTDMHFLAIDENNNVQGMYSRVKENIKHSFLSLEHLGMIQNGVIDTTSEEVKKWTPSFENYTFRESGNQTELTIDISVNQDFKSMFDEMWPKALQALKGLCEK